MFQGKTLIMLISTKTIHTMNYTVKNKHIVTLLAAMAGLSVTSVVKAQFGPGGFGEFIDFFKSPSQTAIAGQLEELNFGSLPDEVKTVIKNVNGYLKEEKGINADLVATRDGLQLEKNNLEQQISDQTKKINDLIAANPLDGQIADEQDALSTLQGELSSKSSELTDASSDVINSDIKISLYNSAINGPVKTAEQAAIDAAKKINDARKQYATGGDRTLTDATATGKAGLQSVVDTIKEVEAGDQAPVIVALESADSDFAAIGAANAEIADIQKLVQTINDELPTLPSISVDQQAEALTLVLNGSYERNAIDTIQSTGIAGIAYRDPATGAVHIGENSLITNEVGGVQELYAQDGAATPININVTKGSDLLVNGVSVATDADVAAEKSDRIAADTVLDGKISTEVSRATAAEGVLDGKIATEKSDRIAADTAEAATRAAADTLLQANISAEATRATTAEGVLDGKIATEKSERIAADTVLDGKITTETARATAAEGVLTTNLATEKSDRIAADTVLDGKITTEKNRATAAEGVLTTNLATEKSDRIAADTVLDGKITTEAATRAAQDTILQANITAEATRATTAEGVLTTNLTKEVADRVTAVNTEKTRALAAESALANRATSLEGRMGRAEGRINSLRKGVSMAAALQTPVIEAGKQNAVKAGVATVDGAQGFGIAVARRINDSVQVNLDVATDFQTDTAARAGVNYSF